MIQQILISTPAWFLMLCILAGLLYAGLLYYREKRNEFSLNRRLLMGAIRALVVAFIAFFLLEPFLRSSTRRTENPVIVVVQDQSASITAGRDSLFYVTQYPEKLNALIGELENRHEVHQYAFGEYFREGIDYRFTDRQTNISEALHEVQSRYLNRNVGALIMAGDGIFNKGIHPHYALQFLNFPVYTIALGDTTPIRDAAIVNVVHNRIAYLNNSFPLEIHLRGILCDGIESSVRVLKDGEILFSERVKFSGNTYNRFIPVQLIADKPGMQRYTVEVLPVDGEVVKGNNSRQVFIEVLEARQKILMLFSAPHPDISAIRQTIEAQQNYEVDVFEASQFSGNLQAYNLVILHQIPSVRQTFTGLLRNISDSGLPQLHILGSGSDLNAFNALSLGLSISGGNRTEETLGALNQDFTLFTLTDELIETLRFFPPLHSPHGNYRESFASNKLFFRRIGNVVTEAPLITFVEVSGRRTGIIAGEGIWRWRISNFARRGNHQAFEELINKSIQYLALREQKDRFIVQTRSSWVENENIEFSAEFYNESYEPLNDPEVEIVIMDDEGKQYPFTFSRSANAYRLRAGLLPPGNYSYTASASWAGSEFSKRGAFSVLPLQVELTNTIADHRLMFGLASRFGGQMFYPDEMSSIAEIINNREDVRPVFYSEKSYLDLIDIKWLLILLIGLLSLEWLLRRLTGAY